MKGYPKAAQGLYKVFVGQALSSALSPLLAGSSLEGLVLLAGLLHFPAILFHCVSSFPASVRLLSRNVYW